MGVGLDLFNCFLFFFLSTSRSQKKRCVRKEKGCVLPESSLSAAFTVFLVSILVHEAFLAQTVPLTRTQVRHLAAGHYLMFSAFPS